MDEDYILNWFAELASALDYIHAQGIVHRDIKLGNVLLNADHGVILSDFGISRIFSKPLKDELKAVTTMVSEVGTGGRLVMGTQGYMAPEVAWGEEATPAADVYSLGVMFVYLLTGIWYTPGSRVFRLLETLEYNWKDVLPRLLAVDPAERPTCLTELVDVVRQGAASPVGAFPRNAQDASPSPVGAFLRNAPLADNKGHFPLRISRKCAHGLFAAAAVLAVAAIGYFALSRRAAPAPDTFDLAFGTAGIYESPRK